MCGIAGILDKDGAPDRAELERMIGSLAHRGPDDSGVFLSGNVGLAHRRLSIIDLSPLGHQPMATPDGAFTLVYNGELYNYLELRRELEQQGVVFRGNSDTEVVLWAFRLWRSGAFARFNGMFALAIWDEARQELTLARDRFGIKPLYLSTTGGMLAFGSEIKALLSLPWVQRRVNVEVVGEYLYYGNSLGHRTLYTGIEKLLPGHVLRWKQGEVRIEPFWTSANVRPVEESFEKATQTVRSLLDEAVGRHLIADVPVGLFLSGGIDSSAIAAFAAKRLGRQLRTYSVGFDFDDSRTELPRATAFARRLGTDHHEVRISGIDLTQTFEDLVVAHDQPFGDAANIPLYLLCDALGDDVKVVLQGDGGDEMFAGYRRYNVLAHSRWWQLLRRTAGPLVPRSARHEWVRRARRMVEAAGHPDPAMAMALLLTEEAHQPSPMRFLSQPLQQAARASDPFARYREVTSAIPPMDAVQRMLYVDASIILPDIFLEKVDRPTMAKSIEVRVPFLDTELATYAMGLPSHWKVQRLQKKYILRKALRGVVPDEVLDAPKKGFGVPFGKWLRGPLKPLLLDTLASPALDPALVDAVAVRSLVDEHLSARRDRGLILYKLLGLALWARKYRVTV